MTETLMEAFDIKHESVIGKPNELLTRLSITKRTANNPSDLNYVTAQLINENFDLSEDSFMALQIKQNKKTKICTPKNQISEPVNLQPRQNHLFDHIDEEPIELEF